MRFIILRLAVAIATFLFGLAVANLRPLNHQTPIRNVNVENAVLRVEREYIRANIERDATALGRVLAPDFTSFGGRVTKADRLAQLSNPDFIIDSLKTSDVDVSTDGDEAWVSGRAQLSGSFMGRDFYRTYRFRRHYEKGETGWQIVSCEFSSVW